MSGIIILIGLLVFLLAIWLLYERRPRAGLLSSGLAVEEPVLNARKLDAKLLAAGLTLKPATFRLIQAGGALAALVIGSAFLPGIPSLVLAGLAVYLPVGWLNNKLNSRGREIDRRLVIALGRISSGMQAGGAVPEVLIEVAGSLNLEAPQNPLSEELLALASALKTTNDPHQAYAAAAERAPSISLSNMVILLEGFATVGGGAYGSVLSDIAARVQQILGARMRAQAKAGDAMVSTRIMPGVMLLLLMYFSTDPLMASSLRAGPVQLVLAGMIAAMAVGFLVMRSMVQEAA